MIFKKGIIIIKRTKIQKEKRRMMQESGENYLETILVLSRRLQYVRSIDIVRELNFSKPSISRAVHLLKEQGLIEIDENSLITLTKQGREKAEAIYERHKILTVFLQETAKVSYELAEQDACKIEHIISNEVFLGIKNYIQDKGKN